MKSESGGTRDRDRQAASAGQVLGHGVSWAASTILFMLGGRELDRWLGSEPLLTLLGAFVGAAAGFYSMYHHLVVEPERRRRESQEREDPRP